MLMKLSVHVQDIVQDVSSEFNQDSSKAYLTYEQINMTLFTEHAFKISETVFAGLLVKGIYGAPYGLSSKCLLRPINHTF